MKEALVKIISGLRELADAIEENLNSEVKKDNKVSNEKPKEEVITLEQVRAVLASKSQSGKQPEVKALIQKYGAEKLTSLDKACYKDLLKEAEEL
ncbi:hypothetical protein [Clostridium beijerinckii]|uniref:hypothetical protein n=1 Tax=Clostridium beijerinckii TaxID=1520 RepID=UPI000809C750|nr:hypothetical protein [Clostridium beijerinckii]OCA97848.1 hypothetical protein BGS1_02140 [Clostridium beijerinckii]